MKVAFSIEKILKNDHVRKRKPWLTDWDRMSGWRKGAFLHNWAPLVHRRLILRWLLDSHPHIIHHHLGSRLMVSIIWVIHHHLWCLVTTSHARIIRHHLWHLLMGCSHLMIVRHRMTSQSWLIHRYLRRRLLNMNWISPLYANFTRTWKANKWQVLTWQVRNKITRHQKPQAHRNNRNSAQKIACITSVKRTRIHQS